MLRDILHAATSDEREKVRTAFTQSTVFAYAAKIPIARAIAEVTQPQRGSLRCLTSTEKVGYAPNVASPTLQLLMVSAGGKIQRIRAANVSEIGRNTQGVRIMRLDEGDTLVSLAL